ncbi:MAG: hypothetical protein NVS1B11_25520 [Terriglobales bacterium]
MKHRFLVVLLVWGSLVFLLSCSTTKTTVNSGTGYLFLTTEGDTSLSAYTVSLSNGGISTNGSKVSTGGAPTAMVFNSTGNSLFVSNSGSNSLCSQPCISSYTVQSGGSVTAGGNQSTGLGVMPMGMAVDSAGKFLFVANEGTFGDPTSGSISVFSISGTTLSPVAGSPFLTETPGETIGTGPVAVAAVGSYLYVANNFTNTVSAFSFDANGALTQLPTPNYPTGTAPAALAVSTAGGFLYVANSGSNNVSAFAVCANASATCPTVNGTLAEVTGSPFAAGLEPISIAVDPATDFIYVADHQSNQISEYSYSTGTGALSPLSPAAVSTGLNPNSVVVQPTGGYVFVANSGGSTVSGFTIGMTVTGTTTTANGILTPLTATLSTGGQPSALIAK